MSRLEVKHLRMIHSIAGTGNMTKAAEKLCVTQSALSQQLKDIEGKLKVDLFYRTRKKMILTSTGKKLLKTAEMVIETLEDAELEIAKIVSGDFGQLRVGTKCVFCYKWLPSALAIFQEKFPNIEFEIGTAVNLQEELESDKFDLIITGAGDGDESMGFLPLFQDHMVCIMPSDHPLSIKPYLIPADFGGTTLISHADRDGSSFYQLVLKPKGIHPKRFMTIGQPQAIIEMVAAGFGVSIVPGWAVKSILEERKLCALPVTGKGLPLTWQVAFLKKNEFPVFQEEFINIVCRMNVTEVGSG